MKKSKMTVMVAMMMIVMLLGSSGVYASGHHSGNHSHKYSCSISKCTKTKKHTHSVCKKKNCSKTKAHKHKGKYYKGHKRSHRHH